MTDIPVFRQEWTGWPEHTNDELSLIQIGLPNDSTLRVTLVRKVVWQGDLLIPGLHVYF